MEHFLYCYFDKHALMVLCNVVGSSILDYSVRVTAQ